MDTGNQTKELFLYEEMKKGKEYAGHAAKKPISRRGLLNL